MHTLWNAALLVLSLLIALVVAVAWLNRDEPAEPGERTVGSVGVMLVVLLGLLLWKIGDRFIPGGAWLNYPWWVVILAAAAFVITLMSFLGDRLRSFIAGIVVLVVIAASVIGLNSDHSVHPTANVCPKKDSVQLVAVHYGEGDKKGKVVTSHGKPTCGVCPNTGQKPVTGDKHGVGKHKTKVDKHNTAVCTSSKPAASTTTSTTVPASSCASGQNVVYDKNTEHRVLSQGLPTTDPPKAMRLIKTYAAHDPRVLQLYYNTAFKGDVNNPPIGDYRFLITGGCYTLTAHDLYERLLGGFGTAKVTTGQAPAYGVNTGVTPGGQPFQENAGAIGGNRTGIMVTMKNGNVFWIMKRCGNVVTPGPIPGIQPKPTPQPQPTPKPPIQRKPKCAGKPFPTICGTPNSGPEQQPVQQHKQKHRKGYVPGNLENVQAVQPVGSPDPSKPIPPTPKGNNSGSPTGGPKGGNTSTGEVQGSVPGQSGGTHGSDQGTEVSTQPPASGDPGPP